MLVNFKDMLQGAYQNKYAIGSFNGYSYETFSGIINAARKDGDLPVIVAFGAKYLTNMSLEDAFSIVNAISRRCPEQAVCLHLDHCKNIQVIIRAIRAGFSSVMYDGSALPFSENVANTKKVCDIAHACGVSVEAELGSLAAGVHSHEGEKTDREIYTDPAQAAEFAEKTGVDALAVSIGTVHGLYKGEPRIRVDILKKINEAVGIPLVLHGGSGTPTETIRECIQNGITKINVNTEISMDAVNNLAEILSNQRPHLSILGTSIEESVERTVTKYIQIFAGN